MKIIEGGLFFIAAALTDLALSQTGGHNLPVGAGLLQIAGIILLVWGIIENCNKGKTTKADKETTDSNSNE
jgi:hypothetical protein